MVQYTTRYTTVSFWSKNHKGLEGWVTYVIPVNTLVNEETDAADIAVATIWDFNRREVFGITRSEDKNK